MVTTYYFKWSCIYCNIVRIHKIYKFKTNTILGCFETWNNNVCVIKLSVYYTNSPNSTVHILIHELQFHFQDCFDILQMIN